MSVFGLWTQIVFVVHIMSFSDVLVKVMLCGWIGCGIHFSSVPLNTCVDF